MRDLYLRVWPCERVVCEKVVCERAVCVSKLCVRARGGCRRRRRRRRSGRECTTKNKNPTQRCVKKEFVKLAFFAKNRVE